MTKKEFLIGNIDLRQSSGIEIGPLHAPIVLKSESDVLYVDYATADILKSTFKHEGVSATEVVDVDIVWGSRPLNEIIARRLDYALASHVIEHVPDLVGWLLEIQSTLKPGASLGLAVPDKRYTFDQYRQESGLGEIIEAYLARRKQPSVRQVFEAMALSKNKPSETGWLPENRKGSLPGEMTERLRTSFPWIRDAFSTNPYYVDVHCWIFTPASFLDVAEGLASLSLFPFKVASFLPTMQNSIEFLVRLETTESSDDPEVVKSINEARQKLYTNCY